MRLRLFSAEAGFLFYALFMHIVNERCAVNGLKQNLYCLACAVQGGEARL